MKVQVFNPQGKSIDMLQNVIKIKDCADGRKLITYEKRCECCKVVSNYVFQVPKGYNIKVLIDGLDEVSIVRFVQEVEHE